MARRTKPPVPGRLDRARDADARAILSRYYEAERAFPHLNQREVAKLVGIEQRDPGRYIRKLRSGERSGKVLRQRLSKPPETKEPGTYVVSTRIGTDTNGRPIIRTAKISIAGKTPRMDIGRVLRTAVGREAVVKAVEATVEGSPLGESQEDDEEAWQIIGAHPAQHRVTKVVHVDWTSAR